jgi:hypothetical protein
LRCRAKNTPDSKIVSFFGGKSKKNLRTTSKWLGRYEHLKRVKGRQEGNLGLPTSNNAVRIDMVKRVEEAGK